MKLMNKKTIRLHFNNYATHYLESLMIWSIYLESIIVLNKNTYIFQYMILSVVIAP